MSADLPESTESRREASVIAVPTAGQRGDPVEPTGMVMEPAPEVLDGELLTREDNQALGERLPGRGRPIARAARQVLARVVVVGESERVATAVGRVALGAGVSVCQGFRSWARRAWDGATMGVHRRQIKAAEAMGNQELLAAWVDRKHHATEHRHKRLLNLPHVARSFAVVCVAGLGALVMAVLLAGLVAQVSGGGSFLGVITGVLTVIRWVAAAVALLWTPGWALMPVVVLAAAWREGQRAGTPGWLATAGEADIDAAIDETTIASALAALRIPQITDYVKKGLPLQFLTVAHQDGRGVHAVVRLPAGVPAERIARRRSDFAAGLFRLAKEVWPTTGAEAGILDIWIANKGALAEGAGPYPLLSDGVVDVFKGIPFGKTLRGDPILAPVMERNTLTGGIPGQGKSSAARVIMVGAALDPTAELRIWVPDSNFDFEAFRPRCSRYVMGAEHDDIAEILAHLRELNAEVQARGELLVRYEIPAVTRKLASANVGLHPLFCLLEEAHVAIQHKAHGAEIAQLLIDIVRLGRKRGIHMIVSTQAPTKDSMPRDVTRNCSNGIAFAVGDHVANDALLGQGAYRGGHRATELIPGTDMGTAVVKGFSGQRSELVQAYFLDVSKGSDQVTPIIKRSLAAIHSRGGGLPGPGTEPPQPQAPRDLLEDLDEVLGDEPVPAADVPPLLARLAPGWVPYRSMTGKSLRAQLAHAHGVKVSSTGNKHPVDPLAVRRALAQRATADLDEWIEESPAASEIPVETSRPRSGGVHRAAWPHSRS